MLYVRYCEKNAGRLLKGSELVVDVKVTSKKRIMFYELPSNLSLRAVQIIVFLLSFSS